MRNLQANYANPQANLRREREAQLLFGCRRKLGGVILNKFTGEEQKFEVIEVSLG